MAKTWNWVAVFIFPYLSMAAQIIIQCFYITTFQLLSFSKIRLKIPIFTVSSKIYFFIKEKKETLIDFLIFDQESLLVLCMYCTCQNQWHKKLNFTKIRYHSWNKAITNILFICKFPFFSSTFMRNLSRLKALLKQN